MHGVEMTVPITEVDPDTGDKVEVGRRPEHVWHCSLAIGPADGALGEGRWRQIAQEFADAMGLTEASGKAPCRWVAIHHGTSKNGNDHIHLVASMVREDGTRWEGRYRDYTKSQQICRQIEVRHGLKVNDGPARGITERGIQPAEHRRAVAAGLDPELAGPRELATRVRAATLASTSEAEFVRRARAEGLVIKPRYAKGTTSEVVGYKAALRPELTDGKWQFLSGGRLGKDLSLPELRRSWAEPTPEQSTAAVGEWRAAHRGTAVDERAGRETRVTALGAERVAAQRLAAFNKRMVGLDHADRPGWARAAREGAGALAAAARADRANAPVWANAARVLARTAAATPARGARSGPEGAMGAAVVMLARGRRGGGIEPTLARELTDTIRAVGRHHRALGHADEAARIRTVLASVQALGLATAAGVTLARAAQRAVETEREADRDRDWWEHEPGREHERAAGLDP